MSANVIAFAGRTANRTAAKLTARAASMAAERTVSAERHDNIVSIAAWRVQSRPRRTPNGVFFTTGVLATLGATA